ncbi:MAG: alpha/beta hydrolase [Clostridia bacterium]|nr:alpha/beta hydrolase [Clostridia bacterium]
MFLHGYLSEGRVFYNQIKFFSNYFQVFSPDLKGFGSNADMSYPYALDDYINDLREYAYKNGLYRPHVIAHSFGGRLAIKIASNNPTAFDKVVLTGCAGLKPKFSLAKSAKRATFNILKRFTPKENLKAFYSKDYLSLSPVMRQSFIKIVNEHLDDEANKIKNQTLLIFGKKDKETPLYMAKRLNEKIKNSKLSVYREAGHFCFLDCPNAFNLEVREFLLSK